MEDKLGQLEGKLRDIEVSMQGTEVAGRALRSEVDEMGSSMSAAGRNASALSRSLGGTLKRSLSSLIFDGAKLSTVMQRLGQSLAEKTFSSALTPVTNAVGSALSNGLQGVFSGAFAKGGVMTSGRVQAFAKGGIVNGPTTFPMRGGTGLMGEAGPEAIMPLTRGADGRLGVRASGQGNVHVVMNITTRDAESFQRSSSQIAAQMSRALSRGNRNL